jgi:hypothetical protein
LNAAWQLTVQHKKDKQKSQTIFAHLDFHTDFTLLLNLKNIIVWYLLHSITYFERDREVNETIANIEQHREW